MSVQNNSIKYNIDYIKDVLNTKIIDIVYKYNGIIYGGFVRDYIIIEYYKSLYYKKFQSLKNYWNNQFDKDTLPRIMNPRDFNICIYKKDDADKMICELNELINNDFGMINVGIEYKNINNNIKNGNINALYIDDSIGLHYYYNYKLTIGNIPYIREGITINVSFNIITCTNTKMKPPFNKLDFLCNAFIMTKEGISISSNTGIERLDNLNILEKKEEEYNIIKDMVNFRTEYCIKFSNFMKNNAIFNVLNINKYACLRIERMISKPFRWEIKNLPIVIQYPKNSKNCYMCFNKIKRKDCMVLLHSNNHKISIMHKNCFFEYIYKQIENKLIAIRIDGCHQKDVNINCPIGNKLLFDSKSKNNI
jgi:hypothetical protein